jgi:GT2 family glycosyltransferase
MSFSIVIPSKNLSNLIACIKAIRECGETARVIVVDDGVDWNALECRGLVSEWLEKSGVEIYDGNVPFVFARNVNIGIRAAGTDDVVVMNDDAILKTPRGLSRLAADAAEYPQCGIIAASVDTCGSFEQIHGDNRHGLHYSPVMLAFICVYIPRRTIDRVGLLDERFSINAGGPGKRGYGLEDDDYCWRVRAEGLKLGVDNDVLVNHTSLPSTFRDDKEHPADVFIHEEVFRQKWGMHPRDPRAWERPKLP